MTTTIGSLAVSLSMDASNFNGSINQMNRHLGAMGSELRAAKALGADYGKSIEGLTSKKDILTRSVATSSVKLTEERRKYDELVASGTANEATLERQARRVNEAQVQYNRLTTELNQVTEELQIQSSAWTQIGQRMEAVGSKMKAIGDGMTSVGKKMSMAITAPIVAAGTASAKLAIDFEAQMDRVGAIAGATAGEMDALNASALKLGADTSKSASEVAVAMEDMAAMGFTAVEIIGAMPGVISASEASGESLALAAQTVAAALNVWGLEASEASRVADVLAMAANMSAAGIADMQLAFKYAGAPAAALGIQLEEVAAAVGIMTDAGLDGSNAGTALRASLLSLNNPAKAQEKIMKQLGFSIIDTEGNAKSLSEMIGDLAESTAHMTEADKVATLAKLVGTEAVSGFLALVKAGPANIDKMTNSLKNSAGASAETAAKMKDNLKGALEELGGTIETAAITIGNKLIPSLRKGAEIIQGLVEKFNALTPEAQKNILVFAGVAAAMGPVLVIGGTLVSSIGSIIKVAGTMSTAIGAAGGATSALGASFALVTGPIGLTIAGLSAVTIGAVALYRHLDQKGLPQIDLFGDKVSDSTQKAVTGFVELNDKATIELNKLSWGGMVVTQDMANSITETFIKMGDQVLAGMQEDHAAQLAQLNTFFSTSNAISEEQEKNVIAQLDKMNEEQATKYQDNMNRINEIIRTASEEKRKTTEAENVELERLKNEQMTTGIKILSDGEVEFLTIMERMKAQSADITAEQAIQTIDDARTTKNDVVAEAEKQYEEAVAAFIRLRDESGAITAEQAEVLIADATRQKDDVISKADEMYSGVLEIAKVKGEEHLTENEIMLGKQLSLWDEWSINITKTSAITYAKVIGSFKGMAIDSAISFGEIRQKGSDAFIGMLQTIDFVMEDLPKLIKRKMAQAVAEITIKVVEFKNAGRDIVQGLIDGMNEKIRDITSTAQSIGNAVITATKNTLQVKSPSRVMIGIGKNVGEGLAIGISSTEALNEKAISDVGKLISDLAKNNAEEVKKISTDAEKERTAIQKDSAAKIEEIERKSAQTVETILKTSVDKKGQLTASGTQRLLNDKRDIAAKIAKIEEDTQTKLAKINEKAWNDMQKKEDEVSKERLDSVQKFISDKKAAEEISLSDEAEIWKTSVKYFKDGTEEKRIAQLALRDAQRAVDKEMLDSGIAYIDEKKRLGQISLKDEIRLLDELSTHFAEHSTKFETIQKRKAQVVKQVNDDVVKTNESFSAKMVDINKKMSDGILKVNEELSSKTKSINDRLSADTLKAKEELTTKSQAINDRLIADQQRLNDEYAKAVDDQYKKILNSTGLFDRLDTSPKQSGDALLGNLQSQLDGLNSWEQEIGKLSSKAIDDGLLAELKEMGPKALPQLLALNSMTEEQLSNYSNMYQEKSSKARQLAEAQMAGMKEDTQRRLEELRSVANAELEQLKTDTYIRINEMRLVADSELAQLRNDANIRITEMRVSANEQLTVLKTEWVAEINNITKATDEEFKSLTQVGKNAGQNLLDGLASMESSLVEKARNIALAVNAALQSALGGSGDVSISGKGASGTSYTPTSKSYTASSTINIYAPTASPSEIARKNQQLQRDMAMSWT